MKLKAYYNEIDKFCCDWLSNLMDEGLITPGYIDNRSIEDVSPDDVAGFIRVGFFAGIGGWDYALNLAGWPKDKPVWHGSCPCQPFSAAGKGLGFADIRHLWPAWFHLISQCRPSAIFGEQVASKAAEPWFDLVQADLEAVGYAFGCVPFPAAGIGAPMLRDRAYWVADASSVRQQRVRERGRGGRNSKDGKSYTGEKWGASEQLEGSCKFGGMANTDKHGRNQGRGGVSSTGDDGIVGNGAPSRLADTESRGRREEQQNTGRLRERTCPQEHEARGLGTRSSVERLANTGSRQLQEQIRWPERRNGAAATHAEHRPTRPTNGQWRNADWLLCRDGKWRPTQSQIQPLAHGVPNRVGLLRGAGNSIVPAQAAEFIKAVMG